ncbi:MAG: glycosyltransferase family 39 protein [Candidatus Margulisbacteria bacterium]|nr:glycosyltransferase family 39 protein [Candidatus Margulisiibacteriota bacterium]
MNFLIAGAAIIYISICGFGLVKLILKDNIPFSLFGLVPLCFGAGLGSLAVLSNLIMLAGLKLSFLTLAAPLFVLFIYALTHFKIRSEFRVSRLIGTLKGFSRQEKFFVLVIVLGVLGVMILSLIFPMNYWDSRAIWGTKAKMLFYDGTVFSSGFMDIQRVQAHFRYPLLFPVAQAFIYFSLGQADDWAIMLFIGLFFPLLLSFLFDLARLYLRDREKALAAAALLAVLPVFFVSDGAAHSGYADTPLALLYCLSFGLTLLWKKNRQLSFLILSAFLSGLLLLTKNEGIILLLLNLGLILWPEKFTLNGLSRNLPNIIRGTLIYSAILLIVIVPWALLVRHLANDLDVNGLLSLNVNNLAGAWPKLPGIISYTTRAFIGLEKNVLGMTFSWAGLWLIFLVMSIISIIYRFSKCLQLSAVVLADFIMITAMFALMQIKTEAYMLGSISRIYLPITSVVALQIVSTLKTLELKREHLIK